jgi:hypothetical protein
MHPDDIDSRRVALQAHLAGASAVYAGGIRALHLGGNTAGCACGLCVRDADGKPLRVAGSMADVDARRRAEDALRVSEERYALAMTGSTGGHWVWEAATDALFVSGTMNVVRPAGGHAASVAPTTSGRSRSPDDRAASPRSTTCGRAERRGSISSTSSLPGDGGIRWI